MPDFPLSGLVNQPVITTFSPEVGLYVPLLGMAASFGLNNTWPSANLAIFLPVEIYRPLSVVKFSVNNGSAVSGNLDVGLYDLAGHRLVSKGSTAQSGTSANQVLDVTDTPLGPGLYYMALAVDNATATFSSWTAGGIAAEYRALGLLQQAAAFPLPDPATFATFTQTFVPLLMLSQKATF